MPGDPAALPQERSAGAYAWAHDGRPKIAVLLAVVGFAIVVGVFLARSHGRHPFPYMAHDPRVSLPDGPLERHSQTLSPCVPFGCGRENRYAVLSWHTKVTFMLGVTTSCDRARRRLPKKHGPSWTTIA